jgi:hypothetical protein
VNVVSHTNVFGDAELVALVEVVVIDCEVVAEEDVVAVVELGPVEVVASEYVEEEL